MNIAMIKRASSMSLMAFLMFSVVHAEEVTLPQRAQQLFEQTVAVAKEKIEIVKEWTVEKGKAAKQELDKAWQKAHANNADAVSDQENNPQPGRAPAPEPTDDLIQIKPADELAEPVTRNRPIIEDSALEGKPVDVRSSDIDQEGSRFRWLRSDEAKWYGKGALALLTIGGVSYVIYKSGVAQRITRSATQKPFTALVTAACVIGAAVYVAQKNGMTPSNLVNTLTLPMF